MPGRVRQRSSRIPGRVWATHVLFFVQLVVFLVFVVGESAPWHTAALEAVALGDASAWLERPWTLASHTLVHRHPLAFMLGAGILLLAGFPVEERLGTPTYLAFYGVSALLVGVLHLALSAAGVVEGRLFTGSVGAAAALLTAYLFLFGHERRVGSLPFPAFYLLAAAALFALLVTIGVDMRRDTTLEISALRKDAYTAEQLGPVERIELLAQMGRERRLRADALTHALGLAVGGAVLGLCAALTHARGRYEVQREIRGLQEEVDARARVEQLLAKISREGLASLTRQEQRYLRYASRFYDRAPDMSTSSPDAAP